MQRIEEAISENKYVYSNKLVVFVYICLCNKCCRAAGKSLEMLLAATNYTKVAEYIMIQHQDDLALFITVLENDAQKGT